MNNDTNSPIGILLTIISIITVIMFSIYHEKNNNNTNILKLFDAIKEVESSNGKFLYGKNGEIGPYQISYPYWKDAIEYYPELGGEYEDVMEENYSESVMLAYWSRYVPIENWNFERLARVHNGGPKGHMKSSTIDYWNKVNNLLD